MRKITIVLLVILALILAACGGDDDAGNTTEGDTLSSSAVLHIVTTTGMIADVTQNIGGEFVDVRALMGPGVDPHLYQATESDVEALLEADIILYNGLHLEAQMAELLADQPNSYPVGEVVPEDRRLMSATLNATDPHIWMDVELWSMVAGRIRDILVERDPDHADAYGTNANTYLVRLNDLDAYVQEQINRIPEQQRVLVTAHDAFHYYGIAYGIEVFAPQGISTVDEASVDDIRAVIDVIVERQVPAIFVETSVPPDVVEAIMEGAADRGQQVEIGGSLFSDAMGTAGTEEGTYMGMIRHNTDTIVSALLGVPAE